MGPIQVLEGGGPPLAARVHQVPLGARLGGGLAQSGSPGGSFIDESSYWGQAVLRPPILLLGRTERDGRWGRVGTPYLWCANLPPRRAPLPFPPAHRPLPAPRGVADLGR